MAVRISPFAQRALSGRGMPLTADREEDNQTDFGSLDPNDVGGVWGDNITLESTGGSRIPSSYYNQLGQARVDTAALARDKFAAEQAAAAAAAERIRQGQAAQAAYLRGQIGAGVPSVISGEIGAQEAAGQKYIQDEYNRLLEALGQRRATGEQQMRLGFDALQTFLQQNPAMAYAQTQRTMPTTTQNALAQYMQSRGVEQGPVQAEIDMLNAQLAGGAENYNQLLNVLTASEQQQQQSRLAEEQMARTLGLSNLGQLYAGATSGLEQTRLAALNDLASRISAARLQAQREAAARDQALSDALAALLGQGYVKPTEAEGGPAPVETTAPAPVVKPSPVEQLAAKLGGIKNESLANRVENFVANNPNATPAQIRKQFPKLGANITR